MARNRVFSVVLLAIGALFMAACAAQRAPPGSLAEKQFQRTAKQYQKFERDGQTVYCKMANTKIIPQTCLSDSELRKQVDDFERSRNTAIGSPIPAGAGQGSVGR
jgi:hypothetical protein